jgi:hypothetical protein
VSDDVHMRWGMVVWIHSHPQSANPKNGWLGDILS